MADPLNRAGRAIAGLIGYNPGPGIYSRLERAVQAMPENVRVEELPGLLKRYKDGIPGWELKATDLDSVIAGRDVVPREELLARVQARSPVYTHKEVVLTDDPPNRQVYYHDITDPSGDVVTPSRYGDMPYYQDEASRLGEGYAHGDTKYADYGQGGSGYTEILLTQPGARAGEYGNHWRGAATSNTDAAEDAVAHARFDTHGDALRINEIQSDLGIHNRKMREQAAQAADALRERGAPLGALAQPNDLPFTLEDAWADLLIKRLAVEAARKGHRAIEVASPRAIADKVGGNIDNYEHFYGKVVPGALERLGRKMGGLVDETQAPADFSQFGYRQALEEANRQVALNNMRAVSDLADAANRHTSAYDIRDARDAFEAYAGSVYRLNAPGRERLVGESPSYFRQARKEQTENAEKLFEALAQIRAGEMRGGDWQANLARARQEIAPMMPGIMRRADLDAALSHTQGSVADLYDAQKRDQVPPAGRRYIMSDEMRRRIIQEGIPAAVAAGMVSDELIERLGEQQ
jgi:hypothetical protein